MAANATTITKDQVVHMLESLATLTKRQVLVGVPSDKGTRQAVAGEPNNANNAMLAYVHEYGAPEQGIPARPFLVPGIKLAKPKLVALLRKAAQQATGSRSAGAVALNALSAAGMLAASTVQGYMTTAPFQALAYGTVKARARRGRKGAIAELTRRADPNGGALDDTALSNADVRPLIDTGQLRRSITFVVRSVKGVGGA